MSPRDTSSSYSDNPDIRVVTSVSIRPISHRSLLLSRAVAFLRSPGSHPHAAIKLCSLPDIRNWPHAELLILARWKLKTFPSRNSQSATNYWINDWMGEIRRLLMVTVRCVVSGSFSAANKFCHLELVKKAVSQLNPRHIGSDDIVDGFLYCSAYIRDSLSDPNWSVCTKIEGLAPARTNELCNICAAIQGNISMFWR